MILEALGGCKLVIEGIACLVVKSLQNNVKIVLSRVSFDETSFDPKNRNLN